MDNDTVPQPEPSVISRQDAKNLGLTRYYTGVPCKNGHLSERNIANKTCLSCINDRYWKNRDKILAEYEKWRRENPSKPRVYSRQSPEEVSARHREYYLKNREKYLQQNRERYKLIDKEAERKRLAEYAAKNPEKVKERKKAWKLANPDVVRAHTRNRRALKKDVGGTHTAEDIQDIHRLQKGKCAICRKKLGEKYDVDHITPIAKGGSNDRSNLQLAHPTCNQRKNRKDPIEYMQSLGFLL